MKAPNGATERWLREVALTWASDACLAYPFSIGSHGYGSATIGSRDTLAHRFVCQAVNGPPPTPKHQAAHECGDKTCVNGRHLRWATRSENETDKVAHGRANRGERHGMARLTKAEAGAIKALQPLSRAPDGYRKEIARRFGVAAHTVGDIWSGRRWTHLS